jgi:hypothetical protein
VTGRALITGLAVAFFGCSLQKSGTGEDLSLGTDSAVDDSSAVIETSTEDSAQEDSVVVDTTPPPDEGIDSTIEETTADTGDAVVDTAPEAETGSTLTVSCTEIVGGTDVNLTAEGTAGWAHYGLTDSTSYDHKAAPDVISNVTAAGGTATRFSVFETSVTWSDGAPTASASKSRTGLYIAAAGSSLTFNVNGDGTPQTLRFYVRIPGGVDGTATLVLGATKATSSLPTSSSIKTYVCESGFATSAAVQVTVTKQAGVSLGLLSATLH